MGREAIDATPTLAQFEQVVRQHQAAVCAAAFGVTADRALSEDVAQETFLAAWRGLPTLRDPARLGEWLRGIARNLAHTARRKRGPIVDAAAREASEATDDLTAEAMARDEARAVWAALAALPARYREALILYYWEDRSARALAAALGISEDAAMQRLSRGRALLRGVLEPRVAAVVRRSRPGAALTLAILAAVAALGSAPGAAATLSRRGLLTSGLALAALGAIAGRGARRRAPAELHADPARSARPLAAPPAHDAPTAIAEAPAASWDELPPVGGVTEVQLTSSDGPEGWVGGALVAAMSTCFADELVDQPCQLAIEVRAGVIASASVESCEGGEHRVVVHRLAEPATPIAPAELAAWFADDQLIRVERDLAAAPDCALSVAAMIETCARARLVGQPVAGPDGTRRLALSWSETRFPPVDREAYAELDVGAGPGFGPAGAPVTVVGFFDLAGGWGFGRKALAAWHEARAQYPDDVRMVVKLCPLTPAHELIAEAIHAAHAQGEFAAMLAHVAALPAPAACTLDELVSHAAALGLDAVRFRADLEGHAYRDALATDQAQMAAMAFDALPAALVNGRRVCGVLSAQTYLDVVEVALARAA